MHDTVYDALAANGKMSPETLTPQLIARLCHMLREVLSRRAVANVIDDVNQCSEKKYLYTYYKVNYFASGGLG